MHALPATEAEIDAFLCAFERCTLPKERWTHAAHLFTGSCYVHRLGEAQAIDMMRGAIPRYNESVGGKNTATSGYHDTITVFWIKVLSRLLDAHPAVAGPMARAAFAKLAVDRFAEDRDILRRYYDFDVIASSEARRSWISPTLRSVEAPSAQ